MTRAQPEARFRFLPMVVVLSALLLAPARAATGEVWACDEACAALIERAEELRLWETPAWRRLMHAPPRRGDRSEARGEAFFLDARGGRDLWAELMASIRVLHATPGPTVDPEDPTRELRTEDGVRVAACRFPARRRWLRETLAPESSTLFAEPACPELAVFRDDTRAAGVSVVFSSYYLNNPASAFGHTFLRIEREDARAGDRRFAMLDFAVDYAASVDTNNALIYALRGLLGLFPGEFSIYPYGFKIQEYNDLESRDIWEYSLRMTEEERHHLVDHLWELGHGWFRYYYTHRNCSWHILGALEVALPHVDLLHHVRAPVIPGETLHALLIQEGLVEEKRWIPSLWTAATARAEPLTTAEVRWARRLARDPALALPDMEPAREALILDVAMDLFDIRNLEAVVLDSSSPQAAQRQSLLMRRAALGVRTSVQQESPPWSESPNRAHPARRLMLDLGAREAGNPWLDVEHRLALHDGLDRNTGYPDGLSIALLRTRVRFEENAPYIHLRDWRFVDIASLSPARRLRTDLSWRLSTGLSRPITGCEGCLAGDLVLAGGATVGPDALLLWWMPATSVALSGALDSPMRFARIGVGASTGFRLRVADRLNLQVEALPLYHPWQPDPLSLGVEGGFRVHLGRAISVGMIGRHTHEGLEAGVRLVGHYRGLRWP